MQGVDAVLNQAVASFNQRCAVAGGRPDGQADYCAAQPCESCHGADGCGWCSGRNVCSNECVSIKGQCGAPPLAPDVKAGLLRIEVSLHGLCKLAREGVG